MTNIMAVTSLKHWIHFLLSSRCPPTSNMLQRTNTLLQFCHIRILILPVSDKADNTRLRGHSRIQTEHAYMSISKAYIIIPSKRRCLATWLTITTADTLCTQFTKDAAKVNVSYVTLPLTHLIFVIFLSPPV